MFLRHFLHLSLVNLPLLASLEERSTHGVLDCFLGVEDRDNLGEEVFVNEATKDVFALFWKAMTVPEIEAFFCFQE